MLKKMQVSLDFLFHIQKCLIVAINSQPTEPDNLYLKRKEKKIKQKLVNSTSTPTGEVSCPSHLHLGESSCSCLSEVTFGPFSSSDGSFPALLG